MSGAVEVGHVAATVHGRYLVRPASSRSAEDGPAPLLVGFHGYADTAEAMLDALLQIPGVEAWHVASVQALHPFYVRSTGRVVAGWMTQLDRELAIADNVAYVESVVGLLGERLAPRRRRVYAGFSQGTAMAYRAAAEAGPACHGILALAGDAPPELAGAASWGGARVLIGRGTEDSWYDLAKCAADESQLRALGSQVEVCVYDGGHVWTDAFRRRAGDFLAGLAG